MCLSVDVPHAFRHIRRFRFVRPWRRWDYRRPDQSSQLSTCKGAAFPHCRKTAAADWIAWRKSQEALSCPSLGGGDFVAGESACELSGGGSSTGTCAKFEELVKSKHRCGSVCAQGTNRGLRPRGSSVGHLLWSWSSLGNCTSDEATRRGQVSSKRNEKISKGGVACLTDGYTVVLNTCMKREPRLDYNT